MIYIKNRFPKKKSYHSQRVKTRKPTTTRSSISIQWLWGMKLHSWGNPTNREEGPWQVMHPISSVWKNATKSRWVFVKHKLHTSWTKQKKRSKHLKVMDFLNDFWWVSERFLMATFTWVFWGVAVDETFAMGWRLESSPRAEKTGVFCVGFQAKTCFPIKAWKYKFKSIQLNRRVNLSQRGQHQWTGDDLQSVCFSMALSSMLEYSSYFSRSNGGIITAWSSGMYSHPSTHQDLPFSWSTAGYGGYWEDNNLHLKNIHFTLCLFLVDDLIDFILLYDYQPAKRMLLLTVYLSNQCTFVFKWWSTRLHWNKTSSKS